MGNNSCLNENNRILNMQKHTQALTISSSSIDLPVPSRATNVERIYLRFVSEKPLLQSIQKKKELYRPFRITIFGQNGIYVGQTRDNRPHGPGQIYFSCQNFLEGLFKNGQIDCDDAIFIESNGNFYRGGFKNSVQTGSGTLRTSGIQWRGRFSAGRMSGIGEMESSDGRHYSGKFINGKMDGKGKLVEKQGDIYQGYFKQGVRWGIGVLKTKKYEYYGPFKNDMKHGKGTIFLPNDQKFQGWFERDRLQGYGEWHKKDGSIVKETYDKMEIEQLLC